jgi:hypothetical protein
MKSNELKQVVQQVFPSSVQRWLKNQVQTYQHRPPLGMARWGDLRRVTPLNEGWGFERGQPIDRYYIERFFAQHSADIVGQVLSIGDDHYAQKYGGSQITKSDVLHIEDGHPDATIIADLTDAEHIPTNSFDSFLLVQTLQLIYEVRLAIKTTYRIMKPGGVVLTTLPGITPLKDEEWNSSWCWGFTALSARLMFEEFFPSENITIETHGNVLSSTAFLQGLAAQEFHQQELDHHDPSYPMIITVRAVKPEVKS